MPRTCTSMDPPVMPVSAASARQRLIHLVIAAPHKTGTPPTAAAQIRMVINVVSVLVWVASMVRRCRCPAAARLPALAGGPPLHPVSRPSPAAADDAARTSCAAWHATRCALLVLRHPASVLLPLALVWGQCSGSSRQTCRHSPYGGSRSYFRTCRTRRMVCTSCQTRLCTCPLGTARSALDGHHHSASGAGPHRTAGSLHKTGPSAC